MNLNNKYLKAWLSFNTSPTEDAKMNSWTTYGNPTIGTANAFNGKALQLDGQSYIKLSGLELGGQDFYIDGWVYVDSSSPNQARVLHIVNSSGFAMLSLRKSPTDTTKLDFWANSYADVSKDYGYTYTSSINSVGERVHFKLVYRYSNKRLSFCINDRISADWTSATQYNRQSFDIYIGALPNGNQGLIGSIDELRIFDGTWYSYNYGTLPTVDEYRQITFSTDVRIKVKHAEKTWRYVNLGDADDLIVSSTIKRNLPTTQSKTGTAFYQTQRVKCFDIPATPEIWIKFDVYFNGSARWRAFNGGDNSNPYNVGVTAQSSSGSFSLVQNSAVIQDTTNTCKTNQLQTVLLHMISGSTAGVVEAWIDGMLIYSFTGDVNHGQDFADFYLQSDGAGTFFSNVIISNAELSQGDGWQELSADTERQIKNRAVVSVDVERDLITSINVPPIGEHFNHYIASLKLFPNKPQRIVLPKSSTVYLHGANQSTIRIFSDTDATGKMADSNTPVSLAECETVFIQVQASPQQVIKNFVRFLSETPLSGSGAEDAAISHCTGGTFSNRSALVNQFMYDLNNSASYAVFLRDYCDIILGNTDTGAITGSDAGGNSIKNPSSVVPENSSPENWITPETGSSTTVNGLTVRFSSTNTNTTAARYIMAGLNSEWIAQSLNLIFETYGMGFNSPTATVKNLTVKFVNIDNTALAYVEPKYSDNVLTGLDLVVNMHFYNDVDVTSVDGRLISSSPNYETAGYLDRTIAHEMTHAVLATNIHNFNWLPAWLKEGTAELVHGIDDLRGGEIVELLTTRKDDLEKAFPIGSVAISSDVYSAGYLLLRYLAKQGQYYITSVDINDLTVNDSATSDSTRTDLSLDVLRELFKTVSPTFDVEILNVSTVEFNADVTRNILTTLKLYPTDNSEYFSGGGSAPIVIPTQPVPPANDEEATVQSIDITLSEQQLTEQVTAVTTIPLDIMFPVQGQFLDYVYDMRVEKVQRQGILYTINCCTDIDELLYTQLNYQLDSGFVYFMPDYGTMTLVQVQGEIDEEVLAQNQGIRKGRASKHFEKIASMLGVECICQFDDFISDINERQKDVTYNDLISQLFGWTARLPQRMINCYLRNGKLIAVQRGHEANIIDISDSDKTLPTVTKELMRTMWGSGKLGIEAETESEHIDKKSLLSEWRMYPFPPTISPDGKTTYVYHNVQGYGGIEHGYALTSTTTKNDDGSKHVVKYLYGFVHGVYTCTSEEATDYDAEGNRIDKRRIIHHNLTPSQRFSRMEDEDGITTSSNVGSNLPGFYDECIILRPALEVGEERDIDVITGFNPLIDTQFPVLDPDIYSKLIQEYAWLNRKTQETVTLSIYNCPHLIDFNDRIILNGVEYFLVSNTAKTTPRIFNEQNLTLRRWY